MKLRFCTKFKISLVNTNTYFSLLFSVSFYTFHEQCKSIDSLYHFNLCLNEDKLLIFVIRYSSPMQFLIVAEEKIFSLILSFNKKYFFCYQWDLERRNFYHSKTQSDCSNIFLLTVGPMSKLSVKRYFELPLVKIFSLLFIKIFYLIHINSDRMNRQLSKPEELSLLVNKLIAKSPKRQI